MTRREFSGRLGGGLKHNQLVVEAGDDRYPVAFFASIGL